MGHSYLAIVDRHGLRALLPEDEYGYHAATKLSQLLGPSACYWAVLTILDAHAVCRELLRLEFQSASQEVCQRAVSLGPVCEITREFPEDC